MPRARNIKPSFFTNDELAECSPFARLLFIGLWTLADREGRIEYRLKKIDAEIFPYEKLNISKILDELLRFPGLLYVYEVEGHKYIQITHFSKHQSPHHREAPSNLPAPAPGSALGSAALIPDSGYLIPDSCPEPASPQADESSGKNTSKNIPDEYVIFSNYFHETQKKKYPFLKYSDIDGAKEIDKLIRLDKHEWITAVKPALLWSLNDEFWSEQIRSLKGLRKSSSSNGAKKFENLLVSYLRNKNKTRPQKKDDGRPHNCYGEGIWEKMSACDRERDIRQWSDGTFPGQKEIKK